MYHPSKVIIPVCAWLTVLLLLAFPAEIRADHIVGGEFNYECLGFKNNDPASDSLRYRVTINMYRDCIDEGAWFDGGDPRANTGPTPTPSADGNISIYIGDKYFIRTLNINLLRFQPVPVNLGNPCLVITEPICQEIGIYTFVVTLPVSTETYTFVYQRCCRNESILNIVTPRQIGATYFIQISPEAQNRCNSSPEFNIDPPIAICINEVFQIDLGATDRNGDSLAYKFCDPKLGGGNDGFGAVYTTESYFDDIVPLEESPYPYESVRWFADRDRTYSTNEQLGTGSTLTLDERTGLLSGVPVHPGTHVLGVCVEEWSRDAVPILLSETKREFQLSVATCGSSVTADLLETEIDAQGRFFIRQCGFGPNTIFNESTLQSSIDTYDWELVGPGGNLVTGNSRDFATNINQQGVFEGIMLLNRNSFADNCKDTAVFLLGVYPDITADFAATEVECDPVPIVFTNLSSGDGGQRITSYDWDLGDGSPRSRSINPVHFYQLPGDFPVRLSLTDVNGCAKEVTKNIEYFPAPPTVIVEPQDGFGCVPFQNQFVNQSIPIDDSYLFEWRFGDGGTSDERDPLHEYGSSGLYDVYLSITSPLGCFVDTTFQRLIDVRDSPTADFEVSPEQPSTIFPEFTVLDRSIDASARRYTIIDGSEGVLFSSPGPDFDYRLRDTATVTITQEVTHPSGCRDTISKNLRLLLENTFNAPNAFTPNGDGLNDSWQPKGMLVGATDYRLRIWDRWGEMIYSTDDFEASWDGTFRGRNSPGGGYLWDATFINAEGGPEAFKGGIVLVR